MTLLRHPGRVAQVLMALVRFGVAPSLRLGRYADVHGAVRLRLALQSLGGAWLKLGQMLAMRLDVLPARYCDELFKLLNQVDPFPYESVSSIIASELGAPPETIFASFERDSFAAASIGQVHRASLHTGEAVAVKVQRPGVRAALRSDIEIMGALAGLMDLLRVFGATRSRDVIDEFARWTADELDYLVEARQATRLADQAQGEPLERVARVYRGYTTSRVLTTELIEGIPLVDIVVAARDGDQVTLDRLAAQGHDLDRIARHLDWNMLNQVYVFGYFHADLHPANLYVLPGDVIGYVDFGIVGQLPERVRESLTRYAWSLFGGDVQPAVEELMRWVAPSTATDPDSARRALVRCHEEFLYGMARHDASADPALTRGPVGPTNPYLALAVAIMETVRKHELTLDSSLVSYLRMLVTLGTLRHQLGRHYDVARTARRFFARLMRRRMLGWLDPRTGMERVHTATARIERAVDFVDFLEGQQPLIATASSSLFGVRRRIRAARRTVVRLTVVILLVGVALYFVLADPEGTRRLLPQGLSYDVVHLGLLALLVLLIARLVLHIRQLGGPD